MRDPQNTTVAVLMGGWSAEREVSLSSGEACAAALRGVGYNVVPVDAQRNIAEVLADLKPDVVFNALHGKWGEDGTVQGILETLEIPYTHSGVLASALAMDKQRAKQIFAQAKIPMAESKVVDIETAAHSHPIPLPYVVKPVAEGSSVGIKILDVGANGPAIGLLDERKFYGDQVMVERFVYGRELTCAVMGDVALGVTEVQPAVGFYDYRAKYEEGGSAHILPADIPEHIYRAVQKHALKAHMALGCRGVSRADFRYDDTEGEDGELIILEVNTQPGMTGTSLVPEMAEHAGHSFEQLLDWMVQDTSCDR
ncbi:MAG: D-alanine--D-alanine ligase [Aestuariivirgaceae bacterium]